MDYQGLHAHSNGLVLRSLWPWFNEARHALKERLASLLSGAQDDR
jgi:hypothetical protein